MSSHATGLLLLLLFLISEILCLFIEFAVWSWQLTGCVPTSHFHLLEESNGCDALMCAEPVFHNYVRNECVWFE